MKKSLALLLSLLLIVSTLSACSTPTADETLPHNAEATTEAIQPTQEAPASSTYEQGDFTGYRYSSSWLNLQFQLPNDMAASDVAVNEYYNEAQKKANPDSYTIIEMDTLDINDSSKCPVSLTAQKLQDNQKSVQQLAYEAKQSLVDMYDELSAYNMSAEVQWDPMREMLFLGETYVMYHYHATTYTKGNLQADMEYWNLYRVKEDHLITFTFSDNYGESRLIDFLELFSAIEGNPTTAYVEDQTTMYDYEYNSELHIPAVILRPNKYNASTINDTILKDLDCYSWSGEYNVTYDWSMINDMVSICVCVDAVPVSDTNYFVYNYPTSIASSGLSSEDFIEKLGMSQEDYQERLIEALKNTFYELYEEFDQDSFFESQLDFTLSESNLQNAVPFYTAADGLCVVATVGSLVGADSYRRIVPLTKKEAYDERSEQSASDPQEDAIQIFWTVGKSNWSGETMGSLTDIVFTSYDVNCHSYQGSSSQYLITLSGEYCPNVVELPSITQYGSITFLIDTVSAEATLMEDSGILDAFEVYIALGTNWYYGG